MINIERIDCEWITGNGPTGTTPIIPSVMRAARDGAAAAFAEDMQKFAREDLDSERPPFRPGWVSSTQVAGPRVSHRPPKR